MGLFSRKTIITVASVIYSMGEEPDDVPDVVKAGAIAASLRSQNVSTAIRDSILQGEGVKLAQAFSYATNKYYAGMPTGLPTQHGSGPVLNTLSKEYLEGVFPGDVITLHTAQVTHESDYETKMRELVADEYDFDFFEDETLSTTGSVITGATLAYTGPFIDNVGHEDEIGYILVFTNPDTSTVTVNKWYDETEFDGYELVTTRVMMEYARDGGRTETFSYEKGGSSNLLNIFLREIQSPSSGTYPAIVLKKNNVYLDDDAFQGEAWETSPAYKTSQTYASRLGLNITTVLDLVKDNPSADDIDYCFIQPGVRLNSTNKPLVKYLYNYFNRLRLTLPENQSVFEDWVEEAEYSEVGDVSANLANGAPAQSVRLHDPDNPESSLDMEVSWRYIRYEELSGTVDGWENECGDYESVTAGYPYRQGIKLVEYETTKLYLRKQLTESTYAQLTVCGLRHENYVYKGHSVQAGLWSAFNDPDSDDGSGFIIPLDYTIFVTLSPRERLQLAQEAIHIVFNCYVARKQKWYETAIFKIVMVIISALLIVFSFGTLAPFVTSTFTAVFATISTVILNATIAVAIASIITALIVVGTMAVIQLIAKEAGEWAAEEWGPEWGAVVQIVTTIALSWGVGQILPTSFPMTPVTVADSVLNSLSYILAAMAAYTEYTHGALQNDIKSWQDYSLGENNPLKQVNDLMEEMFPELTQTQLAVLPQPEDMDEFLGRTLTTTDGLTGRLFLPITDMAQLTLTPRL